MAATFKEIEFAFDFVTFGQTSEHEAYVNIHTGETFYYSAFGDNEEELPDDIDDETKYLTLPDKNDLNLGKQLVLRFVYEYLPEEAEKIEDIFHHKGAYSTFKGILEGKGIVDNWYDYESVAQEKALREWCKFNDITISD